MSLSDSILRERWSPIPGFPPYEASDQGRVRKAAPGKPARLLRLSFNKKLGYFKCGIQRDKKGFTFYVHRLVAMAFLPVPDMAGYVINHKNKDRTDNRLSNLEVVTSETNFLHAHMYGWLQAAARAEIYKILTSDAPVNGLTADAARRSLLRNSRLPAYPAKAHASGQARIHLSNRSIYLGKWGSPESHQRYAQVIAEFAASGLVGVSGLAADRSVQSVLALYWQHICASPRYSKENGKPTSRRHHIEKALSAVRKLYGQNSARDFGPRALKAVRQQWVADGVGRGYTNKLTAIVQSAFRWAVAEELLPGEISHALDAVDPLRKGDSIAPEPRKVRPATPRQILLTWRELPRPLGAMLRVQLLTGMRPGELVRLRWCDIDRSREMWVYLVRHHKTEHHGHVRAVLIGPRAQRVLRRFLDRPAEAPIFTPSGKGKRSVDGHYTVRGYELAIERAARRAGVDHWHPHQLRHAMATRVRKHFGKDAAQQALGHASPQVTDTYAELPVEKAEEAIRRLG